MSWFPGMSVTYFLNDLEMFPLLLLLLLLLLYLLLLTACLTADLSTASQ